MLSAAFDQLSSPSKPHFALYGMLLAIVAVLTCVLELIYKGIKKRVVWMRWGMLWWFYYPPPRKMLFGTLPDMYGLIGGISQCASSAVDYVCALRHIDNPIKISFLPPTFLICVVVSKLIGNGSYTRFKSTIEIPPSPPKQKNKIEKEKADRNFELTSITIDESHSGGSRRWERLRSRRGWGARKMMRTKIIHVRVVEDIPTVEIPILMFKELKRSWKDANTVWSRSCNRPGVFN